MPAKKQTKTEAANPETIREQAVSAMLALAAKDGWANVSFGAIAAEAGIGLATLHDYFEDRFDLLAAYGRVIDRKVLARTNAGDSTLSPRDRLFDLLMERFDVLNADRDGVLAILHGLKLEPKHLVLTLPHLGRSMSWMLEAANIPTAGWQGPARIIGLTIAYVATLRHWIEDDSEDMSPTMAALDKNLGRAEHWAGTFRLD